MRVSTTQLLETACKCIDGMDDVRVIHDGQSVTVITGKRIVDAELNGNGCQWSVGDDNVLVASGDLKSKEDWSAVIQTWLPSETEG